MTNVSEEMCDKRTTEILSKVEEVHSLVVMLHKEFVGELGSDRPGIQEWRRRMDRWVDMHEKMHRAPNSPDPPKSPGLLARILANHDLWKIIAAVAVGLGALGAVFAAAVTAIWE